jgi:hypothetical protein
MDSQERMQAAMSHEQPDRVPVMCQLALGHYVLHCDSRTYRLAGYVWNTWHRPMLWDIDPDAEMSDPASCPAWFTATLQAVRRQAMNVPVHAEVFSPFTHLNEMLNADEATFERAVEDGLRIGEPGSGCVLSSACSVAPHVDPERLKRLTQFALELGRY